MVLFQVLVFCMGLRAVWLSVHYARFFVGSGRRVGRSMVFMLVEQMVSASMTLAFSANSLLSSLLGAPAEDWNAIDAKAAIIMRAIMFAAMIHSTEHLSKSVKNVIEAEA